MRQGSRSVVALLGLAAALAAGSGPAAGAAAPGARALPAVTDGAFRPLSLPAARSAAAAGTLDRQAADAPAANAKAAEPAATAVGSGGSGFTAQTPVRVLDTRNGIGAPKRPVPARGTIRLDLSPRVPADATAVVLNVTSVTTAATYVTVWPAASARPNVSNINVGAGTTRPNAVTVGLGANRGVDLYNNAGNTNLLADLAGYYAPGAGSRYTAVNPVRVLNTKVANLPLGPGASRTVSLAGQVPATATAVTVNLTGVTPTAATYVTAWPTGAARPNASNLNLVAGEVTPNQVTVPLGTNRGVNFFNNAGTTHLMADLAGYYDPTRGGAFYQLTPKRLFDSRPGNQGLDGGAFGTLTFATELPTAATAAVFNLTGLAGTRSTYLTAWPADTSRPGVSNLNLVAGQTASNLTTVRLSPGPLQVSFYNNAGRANLITDLAGYFAPAPPACAAACVHTWGDNLDGQLGVGTTGGFSAAPGRLDGPSGVTAVTAGLLNGYAVDAEGAVWAWGSNELMGLGNGLPYGSGPAPNRVPDLTGVQQIVSGAYTAYARDASGRVLAWGYGEDGSIGDYVHQNTANPTEVSLPADVVDIAAGYSTGYALRADGTVWAWGANGASLGNGQYGTGCDLVPVAAGCRADVPVQVPGLDGVVDIEATLNAAYAIRSDGTVWAWGWNAEGELGLGTPGGDACYPNPAGPNCVAVSPVKVPGLAGVTKIAPGGGTASYAVTAEGRLVSWGSNDKGQLGWGGDLGGGAAAPVLVPNLVDVTDVVAGVDFAQVRKSDGTVWAFGANDVGQLGVPGPNTPRSGPTQVPGLTGVSAIGAGGSNSLAVR
ncbi:hypothetical protein [Actinophytocola sp.]|uniref:hypothetical protein n=1 Tax=Actinophytocola sp. TaxID=1872138 RepID=UPI002ED7EF22